MFLFKGTVQQINGLIVYNPGIVQILVIQKNHTLN